VLGHERLVVELRGRLPSARPPPGLGRSRASPAVVGRRALPRRSQGPSCRDSIGERERERLLALRLVGEVFERPSGRFLWRPARTRGSTSGRPWPARRDGGARSRTVRSARPAPSLVHTREQGLLARRSSPSLLRGSPRCAQATTSADAGRSAGSLARRARQRSSSRADNPATARSVRGCVSCTVARKTALPRAGRTRVDRRGPRRE